jgi:LPS sulfotransferase NodH
MVGAAEREDACGMFVGSCVLKSGNQFADEYDFVPFHGTRRTYMVASVPRSGSHLLCSLLNACEDLGSPFEYLNPGRLAQWEEKTGQTGLVAMLNGLFSTRTSPSGWFGIKAHWDDFESAMSDAAVVRLLNVGRFVQIVRRDKLDQAISWVIAEQTGAWRSIHTAARAPEYDFDAINAALRKIAEQEAGWTSFFERLAQPTLMLSYEELLANADDTISRVRHYLELPRMTTRLEHSPLRQQATSLNLDWKARFVAESQKTKSGAAAKRPSLPIADRLSGRSRLQTRANGGAHVAAKRKRLDTGT